MLRSLATVAALVALAGCLQQPEEASPSPAGPGTPPQGSTPSPSPVEPSAPSPESMRVVAYWDEGEYVAYVEFFAADETKVAVSGSGSETWTDENGNVLLTGDVRVRADEFVRTENALGDELYVWAWFHPPEDFERKSAAEMYSDVTVSLDFTADTGEEWEDVTTTVGLEEPLMAALSDVIDVQVLETGERCQYPYEGGCGGSAWAATVKVTNTHSRPVEICDACFKAHTTVGSTYDWAGSGERTPPSRLDPGASATWTVFFDVPKGERVDRVIYEDYDGRTVTVDV